MSDIITAEKAPCAWQPIDEAPREDGTHVLLHGDGEDFEDCTVVGWWCEDRKRWMPFDGFARLQPTHWMPLPPAPAEAHESQTDKRRADCDRPASAISATMRDAERYRWLRANMIGVIHLIGRPGIGLSGVTGDGLDAQIDDAMAAAPQTPHIMADLGFRQAAREVALLALADQRARLRGLVQDVRDANAAAAGPERFRVLTHTQETAWRRLIEALDGPNA